MSYLADNCKDRLNVIKRVSKPKWGAHPRVTDMLRKALVSSKIAYGISVFGDGTKGAFSQLMKVENACARVVLGAINSTPIHTLWSEMGDSPLNYKREWITVRETVRMGVRKNEFLGEMMARLTRGGVYKQTSRSRVIEENYNKLISIGNSGPKLLPHNLTVRMNLEDYTKEWNEIMVKMVFERIKRHNEEYENIYTDASIKDNEVGVGVFIAGMNVEKCFRVSDGICIMNAELIGILEGIKLATNAGKRKIVIFSDSQCGILVLSKGGGKEGNVYVDLICELIRTCECEVIIQWIPSHKQIEGNERADMLAKRGCGSDMIQVSDKRDVKDVLRELQVNIWMKWVNEYENLSRIKGKKYSELSGTPLKTPFFKVLKGDTRMIRTIERIRLNHGNWKECLYKRHLIDNFTCDDCEVPEDIEHLILHCRKHAQSRAEFSILRSANSLSQIMTEGLNGCMQLYDFVRKSKIEI